MLISHEGSIEQAGMIVSRGFRIELAPKSGMHDSNLIIQYLETNLEIIESGYDKLFQDLFIVNG